MRKIEDVARALDPSLWEAVDNGTEMPFARQISLDAARRAIEAMREPTGGMADAGYRAIHSGADAVWSAMIDAALSEVKG